MKICSGNVCIKVLFTVILASCNYFRVNSQVTVNVSDWECGKGGGRITISGLTGNTVYQVGYTKDAASIAPINFTSKSSGVIVIEDLSSGTYSNIRCNLPGGATANPPGAYEMKSCIAKQTTKFLAAAFTNFTGVQDDDPGNYNQVYARLSQPLNKAQGIHNDASSPDRFIFLRNGMFEITYGNTDKFKMYTFDTLNNRNINKLDLLAHSYINATAAINVLTFIVPLNWKNGTRDMAHIYFDLLTSLFVTNVTDTLAGNSAATNKVYNVKSNIYGLHLKGIFSDAFVTRFNIEVGLKLFWIVGSSNSTTLLLNPQGSNVSDISNMQNISKSLFKRRNLPYTTFDALVQYNTANKSSDNTSNVFIHYSFTSNYAKNLGRNYSNTYFQFQLGYALDITKIFANSNPAVKSTSAPSGSTP